MKILKFLCILFCTGFFFFSKSIAQKKVSELTVVYDFKESNGSLSGTNTIYLKGNLVCSETMSSSYSSSTIFDSKPGTAVILKEVSGQKLMIRLTADDWQDMNKYYDGIVFTNTPETKTIAGYKCIRAVGKTKNGSDITVFYTSEIVPDNKNYNPKFKNLEGLPLEYEMSSGNLKIQYTVSKINLNPVPASKFDIPKSGYRIMTYAESKRN